MENLSDHEKSEVLDNCRKATFLIEKQETEGISSKEKSELEYHISICEMCSTFMKQSVVINEYVRTLMNSGKNELKLEDKFKEQLQKRIDAKLDQFPNES